MTRADATAGLSHQERTRLFAEALKRLEREPGPGFACPYLEGREARHLSLLFRQLRPGYYHSLMDLSFRRLGPLVYRLQCQGCQECQTLRIPVSGFRPSRSQRRALARNLDLSVETGRPEPTAEKQALYRRYLGIWRKYREELNCRMIGISMSIRWGPGHLVGIDGRPAQAHCSTVAPAWPRHADRATEHVTFLQNAGVYDQVFQYQLAE